MEKINEFKNIESRIKNDGYLKSEKEINEFYQESDKDIRLLYKAKLEFLKGNYEVARGIILNDYIPSAGYNNSAAYFLALCNIELKSFARAYIAISRYDDEKKNITTKEEVLALNAFLEKKLSLPLSKDYDKENSYLINQILDYEGYRIIDTTKNKSSKSFEVSDETLLSIKEKIETHLDMAKAVKSLDMFDKYYFYYKNIGKIYNNTCSVFLVKTIRNSNHIMYMEPCIPKSDVNINNYDNFYKSKYKKSIGDDLEDEINKNGFIGTENNINWLYKKYPYIKVIALYKIKLLCALENYAEAIDIIINDYLPTFGGDSNIFFVLVDLYCNIEKYMEAHRLLKMIDMTNCHDDLFFKKYTEYKLMLESNLSIVNTEKYDTYDEKQLYYYDEEYAAQSVYEENIKKENLLSDVFTLNLEEGFTKKTVEDFLQLVKDNLYNCKKTYRNDVRDSYYFEVPLIGYNKKSGEFTDYLCVLTKKNTDQIMRIIPVSKKKWYIINKFYYTEDLKM